MSSSKSVDARAQSARAVAKMARADAATLAEALNERLGDLHEGSIPWSALVEVLARSLDATIDRAISSDEVNEQEKSESVDARAARDEAFDRLYRELVDLRASTKLIYGEAGLSALSFTSPTPREGEALLRQTDAALKGIRDVMALDPINPSFRIDLSVARATLEAAKEGFDRTMTKLVREEHESGVSQEEKDTAVADYDRIFSGATRVLEGLYRIAGVPEKADAIRPSTRRPGRMAMEPALEGEEENGEED